MTGFFQRHKDGDDGYRVSRLAYIAEAAIEYFISLLVTTEFLAALLKQTGVSDKNAGIIASVASFAYISQLITLFLPKGKHVKRNVTMMHLLNQLMFVSLYMIPFFDIPQPMKELIFVVMILGGHIIENCAMPTKLSWMMSFVDADKRGIFSANKEIISLIGGMVFSMLMGRLVDHYKAIGNEQMGFILCGVTIGVLAILHLITLIISKPPRIIENYGTDKVKSLSTIESIKATFTNKAVQKIIVFDTLWQVATQFSISFFGVYLINSETDGGLGLSLAFVAGIKIVHSIARMLFSRFFGRLADKTSQANMLTIAVAIAAAGFLINSFTAPGGGALVEITVKGLGTLSLSKGALTYTLYYVIYAISMAGVNSGRMNLVFEHVPSEISASALAVKSAIAGVLGFFAALAAGFLLESIQSASNTFLGMHIYPQQVLSFITFVILAVLVIFTKAAFGLKKARIK